MKPYCEKLTMPDNRLMAKSFITSSLEHVIQVHPHWHSEVEILFFIEGCAKQQVNEHFFTADPGDIVIIGKDQLHSTYTYGRDECKILVVQFDADSLFGCVPSRKDESMVAGFNSRVMFNNPVKAFTDEGRVLLDCITGMHREMGNMQTGYEYIVRALIYTMSGSLLRSGCYKIEADSLENIKEKHQMLERTFKLIDESYSEDITLKKAASASNLSITHFCRLFKKATGMTFNDYLSFHRVNRAEKMLESSRSITETAMDCGFGSISSFIRNFKKYKNCTPSEYARKK